MMVVTLMVAIQAERELVPAGRVAPEALTLAAHPGAVQKEVPVRVPVAADLRMVVDQAVPMLAVV